jgi:hypothetical protein
MSVLILLHIFSAGDIPLRSAELVELKSEMNGLVAFTGHLTTLAFESAQRTTQLVFGEQKLLAFVPEIHHLRVRSGQHHELTTDPEHFIAANTAKNRRVCAVLIRRSQELEACVLFFEHSMLGVGMGLIRGGDAIGGSFVIGEKAFATQFIHLAAQALLHKRHVHGVSLTVKATREECVRLMGAEAKNRVYVERTPVHKLMLADSYHAMLASMGHRTRRSLATKRRQLEQRSRVIFLPHLEQAQSLEAMEALRTRSWPKRYGKFYETRHRLLCERSEMFTMGMCLPDGTWLSIVSGWRRDGVTYIDLQMNDSHFRKESISAVMRCFLLEHEIARQQKMLFFVGGCSILLGRYCEPGEICTDVVLARPGVRSALFKRMLPLLKPKSRYERLAQEGQGTEA